MHHEVIIVPSSTFSITLTMLPLKTLKKVTAYSLHVSIIIKQHFEQVLGQMC